VIEPLRLPIYNGNHHYGPHAEITPDLAKQIVAMAAQEQPVPPRPDVTTEEAAWSIFEAMTSGSQLDVIGSAHAVLASITAGKVPGVVLRAQVQEEVDALRGQLRLAEHERDEWKTTAFTLEKARDDEKRRVAQLESLAVSIRDQIQEAAP
jgi:hypothetical protein